MFIDFLKITKGLYNSERSKTKKIQKLLGIANNYLNCTIILVRNQILILTGRTNNFMSLSMKLSLFLGLLKFQHQE